MRSAEDYIETILMNANAWGLFEFQLSEGMEPQRQFETYGDDVSLLYLGSKLKGNLKVGDRIRTEDSEWIIAGFLEQNSMIADSYIRWVDKFSLYTTLPLDYEVIEVNSSEAATLNDAFFFSVCDGYSYKDAKRAIIYVSEISDMDVTVANIGSVLTDVERTLEPINKYLVQILIIVGFTACIVLTCFQVINMLLRKSELGILYASGIGLKDMISIILWENALKLLYAVILLIPIFSFVSFKYLESASYAIKNSVTTVFVHEVLLPVGIISLVLVIVSSILPIVMIRRYSPVELMGTKENERVKMKKGIRDTELFLLFLLGFTFVFVMIFGGSNVIGKWAGQYSKDRNEFLTSRAYYVHSENSYMAREENQPGADNFLY